MFLFFAAGAWIVLALLLYTLVIFPFTLPLRSPRWRFLLLAMLAGLLGPGGAGGHGFLPLPSAVGLWIHAGRDVLAAIWHAGAWVITLVLLFFWDKRLLHWFGARANGVSRWLKRLVFGPFSWAPLQFLLVNVLLILGDIFLPPLTTESALLFGAMALMVWLASCYFLGTRVHEHARDYFVSLSFIGAAFLWLVAIESWIGYWQMWLAIGAVAMFFMLSGACYWWGRTRAGAIHKDVALPH